MFLFESAPCVSLFACLLLALPVFVEIMADHKGVSAYSYETRDNTFKQTSNENSPTGLTPLPPVECMGLFTRKTFIYMSYRDQLLCVHFASAACVEGLGRSMYNWN